MNEEIYVKCLNCGERIKITDALTHEIQDKLTESFQKKHESELSEAINNAKKEASLKLLSEIETDKKNRENENVELKDKNDKLQNQILTLMKEMRDLRESDSQKEIELQKRLENELEVEKEKMSKLIQEKAQTEVGFLRKQLDDTKKSLEDANYKLTQRSQQMQGEVLELNLEQSLRENFPIDEIKEVKKGVQGADIIQNVKGQSGRLAGVILWESKDAKWSPSWIAKLREDARNSSANMAIIVSKHLPREIESFTIIDGVIVCAFNFAIPLALILRREVIKLAAAKQTALSKDEKLDFLYEYLQSETFRHRFESFAEGIKNMQEDLETERRSMERIWKKRDIQIKRMMLNASRIYGELQGAIGNSLGDIKVFSLPSDSEI